MTAKQLIEILESFDPNTPVMVDGYEGGVGEPAAATYIGVQIDVNGEDYYGPHEIDPAATTKCIYISRK